MKQRGRMFRRCPLSSRLGFSFCFSLFLFASTRSYGQAEPLSGSGQTPAAAEEAKTYYNAGLQAYERGDFMAAIQAFGEAYRRAPKSPVLFSIAQACRRQFYINRDSSLLKQATSLFRKYLSELPKGARAADASQALAELGPIEERLSASDRSSTTSALVQTRLSVSSGAAGAEVSLDGNEAVETPLIQTVTPGKHRIEVKAPGYEDESREVVAVEGAFVALDVPLREKPAILSVVGDAGARIEVDGKLLGVLPLSAGLPVLPGTHLVAVSDSGHDAYVRELNFARGEQKKLDVKLAVSSRRRISNGFLITAGAGLLVGAAGTIVALVKEGEANKVLDSRNVNSISPADRDSYESARSARGTWTIVAAAGFGSALVFAGLGLALRVFDDPSRNIPTIQSDDSNKRPSSPTAPKRGPSDISLLPSFSPSYVGANMSATF